METERKQSEDERGASANQPSRDDERRVSGRAEVTVRCENSFESSPRLIAEEGRSSTGSLRCSPFFPSCFCCHSRKVPTAIAIAVPSNASSYFHVFPRIYTNLAACHPLCQNSSLNRSIRLAEALLCRNRGRSEGERFKFINSSTSLRRLCDTVSRREHSCIVSVKVIAIDRDIRVSITFARLATFSALRTFRRRRSSTIETTVVVILRQKKGQKSEAKKTDGTKKRNRGIDASPRCTVIISERMSVCRSVESSWCIKRGKGDRGRFGETSAQAVVRILPVLW